MLSIFLLIPLSLMLFVVAIWAVRYAVRSNQFEDLDNASQRIILDDRQERRQTMQAHERAANAPLPHEGMSVSNPSTHEAKTAEAELVEPFDIDENLKT
ncbi:cbb3-type cytochrome oxidase assembly protein CcoS [Psychrobacter sp. APC 3426]|uniref:cbb3-type cytochrome oxidase assembly protein CcoS n=1 Tax=Psychrobacter sp. APC 3426 TaxID=3035177 RepID=UPI0025B3C8DB|nr:cbb3-type cytochrome oxidase assembly protein CcoS [Psychrobacter sp. APC 3426]MDN3398986.1 cbb3-type cytochrome oxidase assembly protein CcoS [Psychrobacter sp. APC 3426]